MSFDHSVLTSITNIRHILCVAPHAFLIFLIVSRHRVLNCGFWGILGDCWALVGVGSVSISMVTWCCLPDLANRCSMLASSLTFSAFSFSISSCSLHSISPKITFSCSSNCLTLLAILMFSHLPLPLDFFFYLILHCVVPVLWPDDIVLQFIFLTAWHH